MYELSCVVVLMFACFCNAEEAHCSRYHYEEQTLAKIVRLEHRLELLETRTRTRDMTSSFRCPNTWIRFENSCYMFPRGNVTFGEAEYLCVEQESHVVHIESEAENTFLKNHLKNLKDSSYWTGLKKDSSGKWIWYSTGKESSFTDWSSHSPNNYGGNQNCVFLESPHNFQWNDITCSNKYQAVCEQTLPLV